MSARPDPEAASSRLRSLLATVPRRVVACSGGIDSLLLATVAHREDPAATVVAHTVTPAVPDDATERVVDHARREGWDLVIVRSREFDDERYLANPTDRCYHCKRNLYAAIDEVREHRAAAPGGGGGERILSGANLDDLGEYRPGLVAAAEHDVAHPYVEASISKSEIRAMARRLGLAEAELPASPCLASRLYTGTRVTASRLGAVDAGERALRELLGVDVVRCRIRGTAVLVEVPAGDRHLVDGAALDAVAAAMRAVEPEITTVGLDDEAYRPGRAFVGAPGAPR